MPYNPQIHHRRSIRLKGYDYSQAGAYFITICCQNRICRFGKIDVRESLSDSQMMLNENGTIAHNEWNKLPERFTNIELDVFQIMPNHMHGIIVLNDVGATLAVAPNTDAPNTDRPHNDDAPHNDDVPHNTDGIKRTGASPAPTNTIIGDMVGAYKSLVANTCLDIYKFKNETMGKLWQRNYHEQIIRNEQSYQTISQYIRNNPAKWNEDKFYRT